MRPRISPTFDPKQVVVTLENVEVLEDPSGIKPTPKVYFDIKIENNSTEPVVSPRVVVVVDLEKREGDSQKGGRSIRFCWAAEGDIVTKKAYKFNYGNDKDLPVIPQGATGVLKDRWMSFGNDEDTAALKKQFVGASVFSCHGKLPNGVVFNQENFPNDKRPFDSHGCYEKVDQEPINSPCYVVTAACGNDKHPLVKLFRKFRSEILTNFHAGRKFIGWYAKNGPAMANAIRGKPVLEKSSRAVLSALSLPVRAVLLKRGNKRRPPSPQA